MTANIVGALGAGSGIDIAALATQLANASKAPAEAALKNRSERNAARLSALAEALGGIDEFAKALDRLVSGGALQSAITSSDPALLSVRRSGNQPLPSVLPRSIIVDAVATAQVMESPTLASDQAPVGGGTLRITVGTRVTDIPVLDADTSVTALASAINAADSGIVASVLGDSSGTRLVLRGETGAANAFTVSLVNGDPSGLGRFASDLPGATGLRLAQSAGDAALRVDGVTLTGPTNSFNAVVPGIVLEARAPSGGRAVAMDLVRPVAALRESVENFVSTFNALSATLTASGEAQGGRQETAIGALRSRLAKLPTMQLRSGQSPATLAEIGVRTNRDGSLAIDSAQLTSALTRNPEAVEALFVSAATSSSPAVVIEQAGRLRPGTYQLSGLAAATGTSSASGMVEGVAMDSSDGYLIAPASSPAAGLALRILPGAPSDATITVEPGLSGALRSIRDELRNKDGAFSAARERLQAEARRIAADTEALNRRADRYLESLNRIFASMDGRVAAARSTQSFLEQQVKIWTARS